MAVRWAEERKFGDLLGGRRVGGGEGEGEGEGYYLSVLEDEAARWPDDRSDGSVETDVFVREGGYPGNVVPRRGWVESLGEVWREEGSVVVWFLKGPVLGFVTAVALFIGVVALLSVLNGWPVDVYNREGRAWDIAVGVWEAVQRAPGFVVGVSKTVFCSVGGESLADAWTSLVSLDWDPQSAWGYLTRFPEVLVRWIGGWLILGFWGILKRLWYSNDGAIGDEILYAHRQMEAQDPTWKVVGLCAIFLSSCLLSYKFG